MNTLLTFTRDEFDTLKYNLPGPSRQMGGYQKFENWLIDNTNLVTMKCCLDERKLERLIRYVNNYGPGGPNGRIRLACRPPLERLGIVLNTEQAGYFAYLKAFREGKENE